MILGYPSGIVIKLKNMGILSEIFGTGSKYSQKEYSVTSEKIKELVSSVTTKSLDAREEVIIENAIIKRRKGDGKISLRQVDETLYKLQNQRKISEFDRKGIVKQFEKYFSKK